MQRLISFYRQHPLTSILIAGLFFRLLAVVFSKGFGMHDDHFLVIEAAQSFADGKDYNRWLPWNRPGMQPSAHSWFYVGLHYVFFEILNITGPEDPQGKMYLVRLLHGLYSMLIVLLGYRIAFKLSGEEAAKRTGWLLSLLWFLPGMSVRNLVEMVCIPPLMGGIYYLILFEEKRSARFVWIAGLFFGLAMGIRFQSMFFVAGCGLYLMWKREWTALLITGFATLCVFFITQSGDLFLWGRPFAEMQAYIEYNILHRTTYFNRPWYQYFMTVGGLLLPPVSLFLFYAYFWNWRRYLILFLPSVLFFAFHSYFPNKQERFILPFIPFMIIAGVCGWEVIRKNIRWKRAEQISWKFFWIVNAIPLVLVSTMYTKRSMVESMYYLYKQPDFTNFVMEVSHRDSPQWPPQFYSGQWNYAYCIYKEWTTDSLNIIVGRDSSAEYPDYVLFFQDDSLQKRVNAFEKETGNKLEYRYTAEPSYMDALLHWLNPRNKNEPVYVYRIVGN